MTQLYPHQQKGVAWLAERKHAMLFDEQGLGKTITAIAAARKLALQRILVICPSVVLWNWRREFLAWWPGVTVQVLDTSKGRFAMPPLGGPQVVATTHGLLLYDNIRSQLLRQQWDLIVLDEAHCFRNPKAKRTRAFYFGSDSIASHADRVWPLSGTPMPNNASELWTHLRALFPERISMRGSDGKPAQPPRPMSFERFQARYCRVRPTAYGLKVFGNKNVDELREVLKPISLRRKERTTLGLPPMRFDTVTVRPKQIPAELLKLEQSFGIAADMLGFVDDASTTIPGSVNEAGVDERLKELEQHESMAAYRRLCGMAKIGPVAELAREDLENDATRKVVIFAHHTDVVEGIAHELRSFGVVTVTGATSALAREVNVRRFQQDEKTRVFVGNIVAAGVGITLTRASEAIMAEMSFVPGENAQAVKRIHRIGQETSTRVRCVSLDGFLDEGIARTLKRKTAMIREVLDDQRG